MAARDVRPSHRADRARSPRGPASASARSCGRAGQINRLERIQIERTEVTEAWQERGHDFVTVLMVGTLLDYVVDATGRVVAGSRTVPERFEEYWTFTRPVGAQPWQLTAIQAG